MRLRSLFICIFTLSLSLVPTLALHAAGPEITAYRLSTCGCCHLWGGHLERNGFQVTMNIVPDMAEYRLRFGVPKKLESCHTAIVEGYTIEGHVPAGDILRLLKERPAAKGLAVPGMATGSPGMEGDGSVRDAYDVLLFTEDGKTSVFHHYPGS